MIATLTACRAENSNNCMRKTIAALALILLPLLNLAAEVSPSTSSAVSATAPNPNLVSVDFSNQEIRDILRTIADKFELNIIIPEDLTGRTSVKLRDVSWRQIYREVLTPIGFTFVEDENIVRVVSVERQADESSHTRRRPTFPDFPFGLTLSLFPYIVLVPISIIQFVLFIAVLRDRLETQSQFLPQWLWAVLVLGGGIVPLLAYWLMHHSALARASSVNRA